MGAKEVVGMLMVQVFGTGLQLLSKVILSHGTFVMALMAYRHVVGALCVAPFAFFWEKYIIFMHCSFCWLNFYLIFLVVLIFFVGFVFLFMSLKISF